AARGLAWSRRASWSVGPPTNRPWPQPRPAAIRILRERQKPQRLQEITTAHKCVRSGGAVGQEPQPARQVKLRIGWAIEPETIITLCRRIAGKVFALCPIAPATAQTGGEVF